MLLRWLLYSVLCLAPISAHSLTFDVIALEFSGGLGFLDGSVRPAIDENGRVVFAGFDPTGADKLFVGSGAGLTLIPLNLADYSNVISLQINANDHIAWTGDRDSLGILRRGAYRTDTAGSFSAILEEGAIVPVNPTDPPVKGNVSLTPNNTVAFTTLADTDGAIQRGPITGPILPLREGSGTFPNNTSLDVNDAGTVAVGMEYGDPTMGLARGVLLFDSAAQGLGQIQTAIEKLPIGVLLDPVITASGIVAFALNSSPTLTFYNPPDDSNGTVVRTISLSPGIYFAIPTDFGEPSALVQVVDTSTGFASFGALRINDVGGFVFRATTATTSGIYSGPDPVADKVLEIGEMFDGRLISFLLLGELNNAGEVTFITSDFFTTDREVWRVSPIPEPGSLAMLLAGAALLLALRSRAGDAPA